MGQKMGLAALVEGKPNLAERRVRVLGVATATGSELRRKQSITVATSSGSEVSWSVGTSLAVPTTSPAGPLSWKAGSSLSIPSPKPSSGSMVGCSVATPTGTLLRIPIRDVSGHGTPAESEGSRANADAVTQVDDEWALVTGHEVVEGAAPARRAAVERDGPEPQLGGETSDDGWEEL